MRATGKTTRLVDKAVQDFFNKGIAIIQDHDNNKCATLEFYRRVHNRLRAEHRNIKCSITESILNSKSYRIFLINENYNKSNRQK